MNKFEYKRIEESKHKKDVDQYLTDIGNDGWKIIYFAELPAQTIKSVRIIMVCEREIIEPKKEKKRLFS